MCIFQPCLGMLTQKVQSDLPISNVSQRPSRRIRTPEDIREEFRRKGISISDWAIANGFPPNLVYEVLAGRRNPTRGKTHCIAVKLGLKPGGEIVEERDIATAINA